MPAESHPIWRLATIVVVLVFVTVFSWINASNFDGTELRTIIGMALAVTGWEALKHKLAGREPNTDAGDS